MIIFFQDLDNILISIAVLLLVLNILTIIKLRKESQRITSFFKGKRVEDLEGVILEILKRQKTTKEEIEKILEKIECLDKIALRSVQKIGVIRFNPFENIGGNQSFSMALLDQKDNGVVISSYHGREGTRVYAKPISHGESEHPLTKEEERAIKEATSS